MNKEEFTYLVGSKLNAEKNELSIANDIFVQKVIDKLEPGETLRVPGIGIFQLNQKKTTPGQFIQSEQKEFQLFFVPQNYNRNEPQDILCLPAKYDKKNSETIDNIFSISYGKNLIPVGANSKKDLLIQSTYLMLQKAFEDKSEKMLENAVYLKDFKIDYRTEANLSLESVMKSEKIDETGPEEENIPWNFGLPLTEMNDSETEEIDKSELPESGQEWNFNQRELPGFEHSEPDKNDFGSKQDFKHEDFGEKVSLSLIPDNFTSDNTTSEEIPAEDEKEHNSNNISPPIEQEPEKEGSFADHLESEMENFYDEENEIDSSGVDEQVRLSPESIYESNPFPPVMDEHEQMQNKPDYYKNISINEHAEPGEEKRGLGAWFWGVIAVFVLVSAAGYYYYFYYAKVNSSDFIKPVHKKVIPQIIEREYSIPVAVIPQDSEKVAARSKEIENKNNSVPDKTEKTNSLGDEKDSGGSLYRSDRKNSSLNDNIYTDGQRFTIQVSSWRTKSVAEKETLELKSSGYDAYISQYKSGRTLLYRVRVGDYASQAEAERVLKELR